MKIVLPDGKIALPLIGLHHVKRGTADHIFNSLIFQLVERDGFTMEELQLALNDFCADTCAVMFGCNIGVSTRLEELFKNLNGRKCANHEGALAAAHGVAAVPYLKGTYMPTLEMMGVQNDASAKKKHAFYPEVGERCSRLPYSTPPPRDAAFWPCKLLMLTDLVPTPSLARPQVNEKNGTTTSVVDRSATTRWHTRGGNVVKTMEPPDYKTTTDVFAHAGTGGEQDGFYEDAGRACPTADGIKRKLATFEMFGMTQALADTLPELVKQGKKLQKWDLTHDAYTEATEGAMSHLKACRDDPATAAPNMHDWKARAAEVERLGLELKRTRGRTDAWIEKQQRLLIESLLLEHEKYFAGNDLVEAIDSLLNIHGPAVPANNDLPDVLWDHCKGNIKMALDRFGVGDHRFLEATQLEKEWKSFYREHLKGARKFEKAWLAKENQRRRSVTAKANAAEARQKVPAADQTKHVEATRCPMPQYVSDAYRKEYELQGTEDSRPMVIMLLATWITFMFSQAPIESFFFQLKQTKTALRHATKQNHFEMSMTLKMNGPGSWNATQAGLDREWVLDHACDVWAERCARKIAIERVTERKQVSVAGKEHGLTLEEDIDASVAMIETVPVKFPKFGWGVGYESTAKYGVDAEKAAAAAKANHDKRVSAGNKAAVDRRSDRFLIEAKDGDMQVVRECLRDLGDMTVSVGDEVACTGWGGTIWYIGTVCGQEKKGKKVVWRVYFGGDHSHSPMPLAPSRYGQATPNEVQPGTVQSWKAGWMFCVPVDSELQARAAPAHNHVNLD